MTKEEDSEVQVEPALGFNTRNTHLFCSHQNPVIHQVASAPTTHDQDFSYFDPSDPQCRDILLDPRTSIPELFAVLRQWIPQVQRNIELIGNQILKRGCGVNDRDGLTDMTLLHYCCKSGAPGIGDADAAASFARQLLSLGADPNLRSRWTNMRALHYAAYFDVPQLIRVVVQASRPGDIDTTCSDFGFGTSLHIAASNLCTAAVRCLLELGANPTFRNEHGQSPADVVPDSMDIPLEMADAASVAKELRTLLREASPWPSSPLPLPLKAQPPPPLSEKARLQLAAVGIRLGERVVIAGQKVGTLRFCGSTEFSSGLWVGLELDGADGKNDGSVAGVQYFTCRMNHGVFAPLSKISKLSERPKTSSTKTSTPVRALRHVNPTRHRAGTAALSHSLSTSSSSLDSPHAAAVRSRPPPRQRLSHRQRQERGPPSPALRSSPATTASSAAGGRSRTPSAGSSVCEGPKVRLGDRVMVVGQRTGVVQFCGKTKFAEGIWFGIRLDKSSGKNDGSVGGVRYFTCPPKHGIFAPPSRVQRIHGSVDCLSELSSSRLNHLFSGTMRRSASTSSGIAGPKESSRRISLSRSRSNTHRQRWSSLSGTRSPAGSGPPLGSDVQVRLRVGLQVLLSSVNEMAVIRYLGSADFAPGLWLGLELRGPKGRNDGSVGGRRYFNCAPGHGVLVRPSRITYRGINGARLVDENSWK